MKTYKIYLSVIVFISITLFGTAIFKTGFHGPAAKGNIAATEISYQDLYNKLNVAAVVSYPAFEYAIRGYGELNAAKKQILVVIDFSKPSTQERLCVIDMARERLLHISHVAHGQGSGGNYATLFSNRPGSHQSSLGFYVTDATYQGNNGYSLILDGLEKGINDKAKERAIVIHGADYCDPAIIESAGRLGRSWGCPALPRDKTESIIDAIKDGALLCIYADDKEYLAQSKILKYNDAVSKVL